MIRVNLLPVRAAQKKEKLRSQISIFILCVVLVLAGSGALYVQKMFALDDLNDQIQDINRQNAQLKKTLGEVADYDKRKKDLQQKLDVLKQLEEGRSGPVHLLDELSNALPPLPDKLWLTEFSEKSGFVDMQGFGDSERTVARFMRRLEKSGYYKNIELTVTEQTAIGGIKMQKFTLRCQKAGPASNPEG